MALKSRRNIILYLLVYLYIYNSDPRQSLRKRLREASIIYLHPKRNTSPKTYKKKRDCVKAEMRQVGCFMGPVCEDKRRPVVRWSICPRVGGARGRSDVSSHRGGTPARVVSRYTHDRQTDAWVDNTISVSTECHRRERSVSVCLSAVTSCCMTVVVKSSGLS